MNFENVRAPYFVVLDCIWNIVFPLSRASHNFEVIGSQNRTIAPNYECWGRSSAQRRDRTRRQPWAPFASISKTPSHYLPLYEFGGGRFKATFPPFSNQRVFCVVCGVSYVPKPHTESQATKQLCEVDCCRVRDRISLIISLLCRRLRAISWLILPASVGLRGIQISSDEWECSCVGWYKPREASKGDTNTTQAKYCGKWSEIYLYWWIDLNLKITC